MAVDENDDRKHRRNTHNNMSSTVEEYLRLLLGQLILVCSELGLEDGVLEKLVQSTAEADALREIIHSPLHTKMRSLAFDAVDQLVDLFRRGGQLSQWSVVEDLNMTVRFALSRARTDRIVKALQNSVEGDNAGQCCVERLKMCLMDAPSKQLFQMMPLFFSVCQLLTGNGYASHAIQLIERVLQVDGRAMNVWLWSQYVDALLVEGRDEQAESIIQQLEQQDHAMFELDPVLSAFVTRFATRSSTSFDSAIARLGIKEAMMVHRIQHDMRTIGYGTLNAYLAAICRYNRTISAIELFNHMKDHGIPVSRRSKSAFIELLVRKVSEYDP